MSTMLQPATIADLYQVEGKAEIINGEMRHFMATGGIPNRAGYRICRSLDDYEQVNGGGYAVADNAGFHVNLPYRESFSPDAAWWTGELTMRFFEGAPAFAAEVRSEGDYGPAAEREMSAKRRDYFAAGTLVVWDVDLLGEDVVRVYRADEPDAPAIYRRGDIAEAEPAVPGWRMNVNELFR